MQISETPDKSGKWEFHYLFISTTFKNAYVFISSADIIDRIVTMDSSQNIEDITVRSNQSDDQITLDVSIQGLFDLKVSASRSLSTRKVRDVKSRQRHNTDTLAWENSWRIHMFTLSMFHKALAPHLEPNHG